MSTVAEKAAKPQINVRTKMTLYDRVSGMLTAWVMLIGFLVLIMFLIWLYLVTNVPTKQPIVFEPPGFDNEENPEGVAEDMEEPGVEEFPEVETPQLADALEAVTDIASTVRANLEAVDGTAPEMGAGKGLGDRRQKGPGGGGKGKVNPQRMTVYVTVANKKEYAQMLEHFDIQIGCINRDTGQIQIATNLTAGKPNVRNSTTKSLRGEGRLPVLPRQPRLFQWDMEFVKAAGIEFNPDLDFVRQMYPSAMIFNMGKLENDVLQSNGVDSRQVRQTRFRVKKTGSGYELEVEKITLTSGETL